jgi:hypothetical protein
MSSSSQRDMRFTPKAEFLYASVISAKCQYWKWQRLALGAACRVDYLNLGVVSSLSKLAPGTDVLSVP